MGTLVDSHHVGEPTTRPYSRPVIVAGISMVPGRRRSSPGIIPSTSRNGCGIGNSANRRAWRRSVKIMLAICTSW
jgi:hypothetical protein